MPHTPQKWKQMCQFYGIEINDFAVTVARTALWIAENQMMKATEESACTMFFTVVPVTMVSENAQR